MMPSAGFGTRGTPPSACARMSPLRSPSSCPAEPDRATAVPRSPAKLGPPSTRCGSVKVSAMLLPAMAGQSGIKPEVSPVMAMVVQISWAIERTMTPFRTSVRGDLPP